jgi:DNA polymerase III subunit epsilon
MGQVTSDTFICFDLETTGLDPVHDRIIEIAIVKFTFDTFLESFETLIDPEKIISRESFEIHKISDDMVAGKPKIQDLLPEILKKLSGHVIIGHGIKLDLDFIIQACKRYDVPTMLTSCRYIDTLRLARLYGQSPTNSLEKLRMHFNIADEGAHRAMNDVIVNIDVFKYLSQNFKTTESIFKRLENPISLKTMPLGKHKGRPFSEIPTEYLRWALGKDFDQDLVFSIKVELKKRKDGHRFHQVANPFSEL